MSLKNRFVLRKASYFCINFLLLCLLCVYFAPYTLKKSHAFIRFSVIFFCNLYACDSEKRPLHVKQLSPLAPSYFVRTKISERPKQTETPTQSEDIPLFGCLCDSVDVFRGVFGFLGFNTYCFSRVVGFRNPVECPTVKERSHAVLLFFFSWLKGLL